MTLRTSFWKLKNAPYLTRQSEALSSFSRKNLIYLRQKVFLLFLLIAFLPLPAKAWKGFDYEKKTTIDVGPGNLVRNGKYIDFYDFRDDKVHNGKVLFMEETPAGIHLQVFDYDDNCERTLIMEESNI